MEAGMKIYFHHPGQLFRAGHDPVIEGNPHRRATSFQIKFQSITSLQKRKDGKKKCNSANFDDDKYLLKNQVKKFNCSFKYKGQYPLTLSPTDSVAPMGKGPQRPPKISRKESSLTHCCYIAFVCLVTCKNSDRNRKI